MLQHQQCLYCGKEFKTSSLTCDCAESKLKYYASTPDTTDREGQSAIPAEGREKTYQYKKHSNSNGEHWVDISEDDVEAFGQIYDIRVKPANSVDNTDIKGMAQTVIDVVNDFILKEKEEIPKLSDKIGHINCDPKALKDPDFVNAVNHMAEKAYNMKSKIKPATTDQWEIAYKQLRGEYEQLNNDYSKLQLQVMEVKPITPATTDREGLEAVKFATWYSGMSDDKVRKAYKRYMTENPQQSQQVKPVKTLQEILIGDGEHPIAEWAKLHVQNCYEPSSDFDRDCMVKCVEVGYDAYAFNVEASQAKPVTPKLQQLHNLQKDACFETLRDVNDKFTEGDKHLKSEWISIKDELPNNGRDILLADIESGIVTTGFMSFQAECFVPFTVMTVTHWKELPAAPKD